MPKKIRELIRDLKKAEFLNRGGRGNHRNFTHSSGAKITLSGNPADDAKRYQERAVEEVFREVNG